MTVKSLGTRAAGWMVALALMASGCGPGGKTVATVNGTKISLAEFEQQMKAFQNMRQGAPSDEGTKRQVLEQMVKQELLVQEAAKEGLDKNPEAAQKINQQTAMYRANLQESIDNAKAQLASIDKAIKSRVLIEELLAAKAKVIGPSDKDIESYYKNIQKQNGGKLPPLKDVKSQISQQIILEKLVATIKEKSQVDMKLEVLAESGPKDNLGMAGSMENLPAPAKP